MSAQPWEPWRQEIEIPVNLPELGMLQGDVVIRREGKRTIAVRVVGALVDRFLDARLEARGFGGGDDG